MNITLPASLLVGVALLFFEAASHAGTLAAMQTGEQYASNQILVKLKPGVPGPARAAIAQTYGARALITLDYEPDFAVAHLPPGQTVAQAIAAYGQDSDVEYAQPNYVYRIQAIPNDTDYGQQWAEKNIGQTIVSGTYAPTSGTAGDDMNLESAWNVQTDCSTVTVAIVDTGINYNSTDLAANMWSGSPRHGQNFAADAPTGPGSDPMDLMGHGTHVAGIIGAVGNNANGVAGVCWKASLMAVRVLDASGTGLTSTIVSGIGYAVAGGARIINMSFGGQVYDPALASAISAAQSGNVLVVAAAGNSGTNNDSANTPVYPCNFTQSSLICVAALDQNYALASFSDYGATTVDVGAPGTNIISTWAGTNATISDLTPGFASPGWTDTSTTSLTSGGWAAGTIGVLNDPKTGWGTALYNAGTDDRVYKTFNLGGVNAAVLDAHAWVNVNNGDHFNVNYSALGGDPFVGVGQSSLSITNFIGGTGPTNWYVFGGLDITPCIGASCTVGFQLTSAAGSGRTFGVKLQNLSITTLTLNNVAYNTISGTSMATPETAGIAALVWAHNPLYTNVDVANAVKNGGRPIPSLSGITTTGKAVDAMGSLAYINPPSGISVVVH